MIPGSIGYAGLNPDKKFLVTGNDDGSITFQSIADSDCKKVLTGHTGRVNTVDFSKTLSVFISGSEDGEVRLWSSMDYMCLRTLITGVGPVWSVAYSPDSKMIAVCGQGGVWVLDTLNDFASTKLTESPTEVGVFDPTNKALVTGGVDGLIQLWWLETNKLMRKFIGHKVGVFSLVFGGDKQTIISMSHDKTTRVWSMLTAECIKKTNTPGNPHVISSNTDFLDVEG